MSVSNRVIQELAVTAELCGTDISQAAAQMMCAELEGYSEAMILAALSRLRREHQGRLTLAAIISRIDDGRPGAEEAWAMFPKDEATTAAMTLEMQEAMGAAWDLIMDGDKIAARMAFKESYEKAVSQARAQRIPVQWRISLGHDKNGREPAISEATRLGRIGVDYALKLLPIEHRDRFYASIGRNDLLLENKQDVNPEGVKKVAALLESMGFGNSY